MAKRLFYTLAILALVRNYLPSHKRVLDGGWHIADCVSRSYDLEGMQVGTFAAGRIGTAVDAPGEARLVVIAMLGIDDVHGLFAPPHPLDQEGIDDGAFLSRPRDEGAGVKVPAELSVGKLGSDGHHAIVPLLKILLTRPSVVFCHGSCLG